jgi:AcrR family transcriptional regulator
MTVSSGSSKPAQGLRERKKAKTRAAIQRHALRLFQEQGYEATTVEQIASAAEVSPSTFFRYFPTKEEVVLYDAFDPLLFAAFRAQPAELKPIQALRRALHEVYGRISPAELARQMERGRLVMTVPELRMRMLDQIAEAVQEMTRLVAERMGRRADELEVRAFAGALVGALMGPLFTAPWDTPMDLLALMDASLAYLEAGLPL